MELLARLLYADLPSLEVLSTNTKDFFSGQDFYKDIVVWRHIATLPENMPLFVRIFLLRPRSKRKALHVGGLYMLSSQYIALCS